MTPPTYNKGQVILISDVNNFMFTQAAWKTAPTSRSSTTVLAADADLQIPLNSVNGTYLIKGIFRYNGASGGNNFKYNFSIPAGAAAGSYSHWNYLGAAGTFGSGCINWAASQTAFCDGTATRFVLTVRGLVVMGGTGGTFSFNWAQNASSATACVLDTNSHLLVREVT